MADGLADYIKAHSPGNPKGESCSTTSAALLPETGSPGALGGDGLALRRLSRRRTG